MPLANFIYTLPLRLRSAFRRDDVEQDLDDELLYHIEQQTAQNVARGMSPSTARAEALKAMGGVARQKDDIRDTRRVEVIENVRRDLRQAWRALRQQRGYAFAAIFTLALGIGANTAIFSVIHGVLLRELPYANPQELVTLGYGRASTVAAGVVLDWKEASNSFSHVGVEEYWTPNISGTDRPEQIKAVRITADMLPLLGVPPLLGRGFLAQEDKPGSERVVVIGYGFWQMRFAGDSGAVGKTIRLDGEQYRIIGVMPQGFQFTPFWADDAVLAAPLILAPKREDRAGSSLRAFARLAPGVTLEHARADLRGIAARLEGRYTGTNQNVTATPLREEVTGNVRSPLMILLGAVALVLLIACANVAHLQLVRATARTREMALRAALGASRTRVIQQSLVETVLVAVIGGILGMVVAAGGVQLFIALAPASIPRLDEIGIDATVLVFAVLVTLVAGLACGAMPAAKAASLPSHEVLKDGGRSTGDSARQRRTRSALIVSEFALALVLLVGAGLLVRSFNALLNVDPGYRTQRLLSMEVSVKGTSHEAVPARTEFFSQVLERVRQLPGVEAASAINHVPLNGDDWRFPFYIESQPAPKAGAEPKAEFLVVHPGYFEALGIPFVRGEAISAAQFRAADHVVVINETMARRHWPGENPVGKRISVDDPARGADWFRVVGVVRDVRQSSWTRRESKQMYFPYIHDARRPEREMSLASFLHPHYTTLVVRTSSDPAAMTNAIRTAVRELDSDAPVSSVMTMEEAISEEFATPRFYAVLIGSLAFIAMVLAGIGVYGVISYSVARRLHEIGIRIALGAQQSQVFRMVLSQGMRLAAVGAVLGVIGAFGLSRYLRGLLYDVTPSDPLTFVVVSGGLCVVAVAACWFPARRALRVAPADALREG
jgi:predicted permease